VAGCGRDPADREVDPRQRKKEQGGDASRVLLAGPFGRDPMIVSLSVSEEPTTSATVRDA